MCAPIGDGIIPVEKSTNLSQIYMGHNLIIFSWFVVDAILLVRVNHKIHKNWATMNSNDSTVCQSMYKYL